MRAKILASVLAILALAFMWLYSTVTESEYLKSNLSHLITNHCPTCSVKIDHIKLSPLSGHFEVSGVSIFHASERQSVQYSFTKLNGNIKTLPLLTKKIIVEQVEVNGSQSHVQDYDTNQSRIPQSTKEKKFSIFGLFESIEIEKLKLSPSNFQYTNHYKSRVANLHLQDVHATIQNIHYPNQSTGFPAVAIAHAKLENSGKVRIRLDIPLFYSPLQIKTQVQLSDHDLASTNEYFKYDSGISLSGHLKKANAQVIVKGPKATSSAYIEFSDFNVKFNPLEERSAFVSWILNMFEDFIFSTHNTGKKSADKVQEAQITRNDGEAIVPFILRAMQEAAIEVAKN